MTSHNLKGVKAGDELLLTSSTWTARRNTNPPKTVTVEKVGTKLVYIKEYGRPTAYRIENGIGNDYRDGELWKREDWELELERPALEDALKRHRIDVRGVSSISVTTMKKLLAVMEGDE